MYRMFVFLALWAGAAAAWAQAVQPATQIGIISYWGSDPGVYKQIPQGSLALVNPDNGIFVSAGQTETLVPDLHQYQTIVKQQAARGVSMLGYVPTGYFNHGCNAIGQCQTIARIDAQVAAYFAAMPKLAGIFFDEAAPSVWNCAAFPAEYATLRNIVHKYAPGARIAFNAGVPDNCAVAGAKAGEILVLFENDAAAYAAQSENVSVSTLTALEKGVIPWHLIDTATNVTDLDTVFAQAQATDAAYVYVTNIGGDWQHGDNTWGSPPVYWSQEVALIQAANQLTTPACSSLSDTPAAWTVLKVPLHNVGQFAYEYLFTHDASGQTWLFDGQHWNKGSPGSAGVYATLNLGVQLSVTDSAAAAAFTSAPAGARGLQLSYALAAQPSLLHERVQVCR